MSDRSITTGAAPAQNDILAILDARTTAMTIPECAALLNIDHTTLYRQAKIGKFPVFTVCNSLRVNPAELAASLRATSNISTAPIDRRKRQR